MQLRQNLNYFNYEIKAINTLMTTIFVNLEAKGSNNGSSWSNAYTNLQTAIANAKSRDEIWVAKGIYRPTLGTERTVSFVLKNGVKMYGGFAGNETSINQRDIEKNVTKLSGDIGTQGSNSDNTYNVVDISNTTKDSVLDGFSITNGNADEYSGKYSAGGGIYSKESSAVLTNLIIANNNARKGGGIYSNSSQLELSNVLFLNNSAIDDGGGLYNYSSSPIVNKVTFNGNSASDDGGAIYNYSSSPSITDVKFNANYAGSGAGGAIHNYYNSSPNIVDASFLKNGAYEGGAIYNGYRSNPIIDRVVFKDNVAENAGGGVYNYNNNENTVIANSLFEGNISPYGAGIYNNSSEVVVTNSTFTNNQSRYGAAIRTKGSDLPSVTNSIIWDNDSIVDGNSIANQKDSKANTAVNNSLVEGGYNGDNIVTKDPQFIASNKLDFRLASNSPAINAGYNDASSNFDKDLAGNARIASNTVDFGAYEGSSVTGPAIFSLTDESVVIYVDKDAKGKSNGTSWANAYTDLQRAIAAAPFGSQIWVAEGTYKPTLKVGTDARQYSFRLRNGVAIYGGFVGNETKLGQRDIDSNPTILSGDINKTGHADDNSYHVVVADYTTSSTILDGFTISDGNANSYSNSNDDGGGIHAYQSQAIFANLIIQNNKASDKGGGVYTSDGLNQFVNVSFIYNTANYNGGGLYSNSSSILTNTIFDNNAANYGGAVYNAGSLIANGTALANNIAKNSGGGIYSNYKSSFNLTNTVFDSNRATSYGGAIYNYNTGSSSTIVNSIFDRNTSKIGGAIYNTSSSAVGTNLTFANNQAESGAAVYSNGNSNNKPTYYNSIFWGNKGTSNTSPIANNSVGTIVRNSIVQGGYDGLEVTNEDPKFANLGLGDFRLQKDSPAVDAGINEFVVAQTDLIGNARVVDGKVDIGAYEYFAKQDLSNVSGTIGDSDIPVININPEDRFEMADIHRFYQPQKGLHLYTSDVNEINHIKKQSAVGVLNYNYEEEKYTVLNSDRDALTGKGIEGVKPVYRFFNNDTGAHLYTMDENEKNYILDRLPNYGFENIKYYAFESQPENLETFPVYRMRNSDTGAHLFTVDQNEVNYIRNNLSNYSLEGNGGVAFYVFALD